MEHITTWKDLERSDKIVIIVGIVLWAMLEFGVYKEASRCAQLKQNVSKTEMVRGR